MSYTRTMAACLKTGATAAWRPLALSPSLAISVTYIWVSSFMANSAPSLAPVLKQTASGAIVGAVDEIRTRDFHLGKVALYH